MTRKLLSRRAVLRGLGGTAIALPFLDAMGGLGRARAEGPAAPRRLIIMYTPNGTVPRNFWPQGSEHSFSLSRILAPLQAHKGDLLILEGVDMESSKSGPGDAHQKGTGHCLTGTELQEGNFPGDAGTAAGWASGPSIDQYVARHVGQETLFSSLEFGVAVQGSGVDARISYRGPGQPIPAENSPYAMFERLFGDAVRNPEGNQREVLRRQSVLDAVAGQYRALRARLGPADREKLEVHLSAVGDIQNRLAKGVVTFDSTCQPLAMGEPVDPERAVNMGVVGDLQMDLLAMSMACDLTRVATLMWTNSRAEHVLSFADSNIREGHHSLAHKGDHDTPKVEQNTNVNIWYAQRLAYLIDKLKAIPDASGGSVFDHTVILWTNEQAKGNTHERDSMPYVLAGSAGGYFKTGRYVTMTQKTAHNRLLVSLMNAMGSDGDVFGNPMFGTGPIAGLT